MRLDHDHQTGFTLLETLVALALIMGAVAGPFTLATKGIFSTKFSKNKLIALNLALEGVEIIRSYRDTNSLVNTPLWDDGIIIGSSYVDVICSTEPCKPPGATPHYSACAAPCNTNLNPLLSDAISGLYSYGTGNASLFTRIVTVSHPGGDSDQLSVVSTVTWADSGISRQVQLQEVLYNWQ